MTEEKDKIKSKVFDKDEALLKRTDKLFDKEAIETFITNVTPKQAFLFSIYDSFHEMVDQKGQKRFSELFPKRFRLYAVGVDGQIRKEFLELYKQRPTQAIYPFSSMDIEQKQQKTISSKLLGK